MREGWYSGYSCRGQYVSWVGVLVQQRNWVTAGQAVSFTRTRASAQKAGETILCMDVQLLSQPHHPEPLLAGDRNALDNLDPSCSPSAAHTPVVDSHASSPSPSIPDSAAGPSTSENNTSDNLGQSSLSGSEYAADGDDGDKVSDDDIVPQTHWNYTTPCKVHQVVTI